jgi:hypothetical protein
MCVSPKSVIDRRLVHRTLDTEVFITKFSEEGEHQWRSVVCIPSEHARMRRSNGSLPIILALEVLRQGGFVAAHKGMGVPLEWHFVIQHFGIRWDSQPPAIPTGARFRAELVTRIVNTQFRDGLPSVLVYEFDLVYKGEVIATGNGITLCINPPRYHALRKRALSSPTSPHHCEDHPFSRDEQGQLTIRWNDQDPFLFNRPGDHVVSMALIDSFIAAASDHNHSEKHIQSFDISFISFAECNQVIHLDIDSDDPVTMTGKFVQDGRVIAEAKIGRTT